MIAAPVRVQPLFEYELELGGRHTRVLELEGAGPPVLLLHGYADSADTWRLVLAQLARAGQRAVAIDLPGFGRADALAPGAILPQLDAVVDAVVAHAGGRPRQPVIVVGNSLGGCLAIRAGARLPGRIAGVMAAAPAGYDMKRLISLIEYDPLLHTLLGLPTPIPSAVIKASAARIYCQLAFASVRGIDPQVVASFVSHISGRARAATYLDIGHRLVPELRDALTLETMRAPLLVVWGKRDRMLAASGAEKILAALPETRLELLDGIGHCPQVEAPARFAELLIEFAEAQVRAGADADVSTGRAAV